VTTVNKHRSKPALVVRWIARILSILTIGIILLFFVGEADFSQPVSLSLKDVIGLLFFPLGVLIGMLVAWRWEGIGAGITVGSLVAFYLSHFLLWHGFPSGPYFALFASPGAIFGIAWLLSRPRQELEPGD
jgi:hypothetical protein